MFLGPPHFQPAQHTHACAVDSATAPGEALAVPLRFGSNVVTCLVANGTMKKRVRLKEREDIHIAYLLVQEVTVATESSAGR